MTDEPDLSIFEEAGRTLAHLVALTRDENDPRLLLMGEEIEHMDEDDAKVVLAAAVVLLAQRRQI